MPRSVSAREPFTARVSSLALINCGVSAAFVAVAVPPAKSAAVKIACPIKLIRHVFISTSLPCHSLDQSPVTGPEPSLPTHSSPFTSRSLLQKLHQVIVAFFRIHDRQLGHRGLQ